MLKHTQLLKSESCAVNKHTFIIYHNTVSPGLCIRMLPVASRDIKPAKLGGRQGFSAVARRQGVNGHHTRSAAICYGGMGCHQANVNSLNTNLKVSIYYRL